MSNLESVPDVKYKTIEGFFWRLGERVSAQIVTFIVTVILARILNPRDYGTVAIVNVFISIVDILITGGLSSALVQKKDTDEIDFSTIFYTSLILALLLYVFLFLISPFISYIYKNNLLTPVLRVMGIKFFISAINSVQIAYVSRKMIFKKFFFATISGTIISAVVGITIAINGGGVWALVAQALTNPFIDTIILFITVKWHPVINFSYNRLKILFGYGWKISVASFIGTVFDKIKQLFIGFKYSSVDLAFYNRGEALPVLITSNITSTLESVLFPAMSKYQNNIVLLKNAVRHSVKLGSYVLTPLLVGLSVVSDKLVIAIYGDKWRESIPFVSILSLSLIPSIISTINMQAIKASGRSDVILILEFIKKPIFIIIVLACVFISPIAMAWGAVIYGIISCIINYFPNVKILNYSFKEQIIDVFENFLLSAIMAIPVYFIGKIEYNLYIILLLQIICGISCYIIISMIFKVQCFYEIKNMIFKRIRIHEYKK